MEKFVEIKKILLVFIIISVFLAVGFIPFSLFMTTKADTDQQTSSDSQSSSSSSASSDSMSVEEVNQILETLKTTSNSAEVSAKMDELIKRATLTGNTKLKEYAEYTKQVYSLRDQVDNLNALIQAITSKNSEIKKIDDQLKTGLDSSTSDASAETVKNGMSASAAELISELSDADYAKIQDKLTNLKNVVDLKNLSSESSENRSLAEVVILKECINAELFKDGKKDAANNAITESLAVLQEYERSKYTSMEYNSMKTSAEGFKKSANKSDVAFPESVIMMGNYFVLKNTPIKYDGEILASLDDLHQYIDTSVQYSDNNSTIAIKSKNLLLEIARGKNNAYVNDKSQNIPVPVLSYNSCSYLSVEFFAQTYNIGFIKLEDHGTVIMYDNLNQLSNPSVPNNFNKAS